MVKSLVLHLGDHKTGSTSIQHALKKGAVTASGRSILYPVPPGNFQHHSYAVRTLIRNKFRNDRKGHFVELAKMMVHSDADVAILSAENFEFADPKRVRETLTEFFPELAPTARLIVYLRPHAERTLSSYVEQIKQGLFSGTLEAFHDQTLEDQRLFYAPRLARWREQFGNRLTVRPMVRSQILNGDVVQDFIDFALDGAAFSFENLPQSNQRLCLEDLSLLATLQKRVCHIGDNNTAAFHDAARSLGWRVARMLESSRKTSGTPVALHMALAERIIKDYGQDAALVDQRYFTGTPLGDRLQAACDSAVPDAQSMQIEAHLSPTNLRLTLAWLDLIETLVSVQPDQWSEYFKSNPFVSTVA